MNSSILGMTDADVTRGFVQLYNRFPSDKEAQEQLAKLFDVSPKTIRDQFQRTAKGKNISATLLAKMCWLIYMARASQTHVRDPELLDPSSELRQEALYALRAELREEIEEELREEIEALKEEMAERRMKEKAEKQTMKQREENVTRRERKVAQSGHRRRIILEEMTEGGLLEPSATKSLLGAKLELEAGDQCENQEAQMKSVARMEKEKVFNILSSPIRAILALFMR